jgi:hypothetical protein
LIRRSWSLGVRYFLRLLAFVVIIVAGLVIVWLAGEFVVGSLVTLALGPAEPGGFSALVLAFFVALILGAFTVVSAVMLARIYLQLVRGDAQAGVPSSGT